MLPNSKERDHNLKHIAIVLFLFSLGLFILGGINFFKTTSTFYLNGEKATAVVKDIERNKWPRFRTFNYTLEFYDSQNKQINTNTTAAEFVAPGNTVEIMYSKSTPENAYFAHAFLHSVSYSIGTIALALLMSIFGLNQLYTKKRGATSGSNQQQIRTLRPSTQVEMPQSFRTLQNILILLLICCIIIYVLGEMG